MTKCACVLLDEEVPLAQLCQDQFPLPELRNLWDQSREFRTDGCRLIKHICLQRVTATLGSP